MVRASDSGSRGPEFEPRLQQGKFLFLFDIDTKVIDVLKSHRPICHGPSVRRRSIGPLPSCYGAPVNKNTCICMSVTANISIIFMELELN